MNVTNIVETEKKIRYRYRYKIHDKLYDLTEFVKIHPGGQDMFNNLKPDTNITPMIYAYHKNPKSILLMLPKYEVPFRTDLIKIEYDTNYTYDSYCELKKLVYDEIKEKKIPLYWSNKEIAYNAFMLSVYLGTWGYCFYYANNLSYLWMVLLALIVIGWGTLVIHETTHHTGFKNQKYNLLLSNILHIPYLPINEWKWKHNYLHHNFTNTIYDSDFEENKYILRHSQNHTLFIYHKYQWIYMFFLFWLNGYNNSILQMNNITFFLVISFLVYIFGYLKILLLFGCIGFGYTFVANLSHIQHECIQLKNEKKNDFLYNQVSSSMNYRTDDFITRFLCFGLDIQIEHHLFPNIPHSSLRQIQHIVREYCDTHNIPYIEKSSIFPTIYSYICYLYRMGNP